MRTNGLLYIQHKPALNGAETGFDEAGNPIVASVSWSRPLQCSVCTNTDTRKGVYEDGIFRAASYTILLEQTDLPCRRADMVKLTRDGEFIGEFFVLSVELLSSVGRIKIIV